MTSCSSDVDTANVGYTTYTSPSANFSVDYPENWQTQEWALGTLLVVNSPMEWEDDTFSENLNFITQDISDMGVSDFTEYVDLNISQIETLFNDYSLISREVVEIDSIEWEKIVSEFTQWNFDISIAQYILNRDGEAFIISFTNSQEEKNKFEAEFDAILSSLQL